MQPETISLRTVCGLEELDGHSAREVSHVLSLIDPGTPDPAAFERYGEHRRVTLRFHDVIAPAPGMVAPGERDVAEILAFGESVAEGDHLLIHCHMGISRSTAAMTALIARAHAELDETEVVGRLREIRPQAWPNARMIGFADRLLGRNGRLSEAVRRLHAAQLEARPEIETFMRAVGRDAEVEAAHAGTRRGSSVLV